MFLQQRPVGEHLDARQRRVIHFQHQVMCYTPPEIAVLNMIPERTIQLVLQRAKLMDDVIRNPSLEGRSRTLKEEDREVCCQTRHCVHCN